MKITLKKVLIVVEFEGKERKMNVEGEAVVSYSWWEIEEITRRSVRTTGGCSLIPPAMPGSLTVLLLFLFEPFNNEGGSFLFDDDDDDGRGCVAAACGCGRGCGCGGGASCCWGW